MLKRKVMHELEAWKRSFSDEALFVTGPRQVGKSPSSSLRVTPVGLCSNRLAHRRASKNTSVSSCG